MQSLFGPKTAHDPIIQALRQADVAVQAGPWQQVLVRAVGAVTALGIDRKSEDIIVTSGNGQSIISGVTGEIIYRNREDDGLDRAALKGTRLDHPADERFDMAGLYGGGLRTVTDDGWTVERYADYCLLHPPKASIHYLHPKWADNTFDATFHVLDKGGEDIRALGFSWTGRTLVCATSSTLTIWGRPAPLAL